MEIQDMNTNVKEIIDYWNKQPCNIKHSQFEVGTLQYFEEVSKKRYFVEPHIKNFADFENCRNKRILEIGCGIGTDAVEFAKAGAEYVGIDISSESIEISKKRFEIYELTGTFLNLNADSNDILNLGKFDLVYSFGVLHHYPMINSIIDKIYHVTNPNGNLKFMVYARNSWKFAMIENGLDQFESQANCPYAKVYTEEEINLLLHNKFFIESIRQDHCFMYKIPEYKKNVYELEPWFSAMPEKMRQALKNNLGWHLLVDAKKINE